jgi:glycosyltransferase involved in cell wall biosynthesis
MQLSEHIIPVGFIKGREELAKHYSLSNVFVNATHADTLPTVNMESICCGTPVITYNNSGSPELILDGCGFSHK